MSHFDRKTSKLFMMVFVFVLVLSCFNIVNVSARPVSNPGNGFKDATVEFTENENEVKLTWEYNKEGSDYKNATYVKVSFLHWGKTELKCNPKQDADGLNITLSLTTKTEVICSNFSVGSIYGKVALWKDNDMLTQNSSITSNILYNPLKVDKTYNFTDLKGIAKDRQDDIKWLSSVGVTIGTGCDKNGGGKNCKYLPNNPVNRGAMAEFLQKINKTSVTYKKAVKITDISKLSAPRQKSIKWLAAEKITVPTNSKYKPNNTVNRGAMAEFLYKLAGSPCETDNCSSAEAYETLVRNGYEMVKIGNETVYIAKPGPDKEFLALEKTNPNRFYAILWLYSTGITKGYGGDKRMFKPNAPVNRGSMAQFLKKFYEMCMGEFFSGVGP
ncbi:MAG: S-layer homology domain-containing protein [Bifidobacteriaceae bacterium]|jgi:hypothetical protein|nr:S-layer homology domain-containing protein [Bifidobacteriaceae bacterium]